MPRRLFKRAKEALSICRRDVRKLITAAIDEGADGDWEAIEAMYVALGTRLPRASNRIETEAVLEEMTMLRDEIVNILDMQLNSQKTDGNDVQNG
ncbi:replication initiation protein RepC, partial [Rhizobium sp. YJ-22]|nr:replication initiation protein RepC [Rhizobium sp. YJ-22]